jgi:hypothetical protein|tara:strand:+ start:233 stop:376 length:144 start_codon:yes stop_codon:yes gene_type:complete
MSQRKEIGKFLKNISIGEYKNAHLNLQTVVEDKLKQKIKRAAKQRIF